MVISRNMHVLFVLDGLDFERNVDILFLSRSELIGFLGWGFGEKIDSVEDAAELVFGRGDIF